MSLNNKDEATAIPPELMRRVFGGPDEVANQLAELRKEVAAIREALNPPKSAILTGPEVERVFASMNGGRK